MSNTTTTMDSYEKVSNICELLDEIKVENEQKSYYEHLIKQEMIGLPNNYKLLLDKETIKAAVKKCAFSIYNHFIKQAIDSDTTVEIVLLRILKGATYFANDLARSLRDIIQVEGTYNKIVLRDEFVTASSYFDDIKPRSVTIGSYNFHLGQLVGKKIILVDELLDKGETIKELRNWAIMSGCDEKNIYSCVAFMKDKPRVIEPNWFGFIVPDIWLIGYGLDDKQYYRELEIVCYIDKPSSIEQTDDDKKFCVEDYHKTVDEYITNVKKSLIM